MHLLFSKLEHSLDICVINSQKWTLPTWTTEQKLADLTLSTQGLHHMHSNELAIRLNLNESSLVLIVTQF